MGKLWVHPRVSGVLNEPRRYLGYDGGSSPRERGFAACSLSGRGGLGFIPA